MSSIGIKTGDTIEVVTGKDRGKRGKVLAADPATAGNADASVKGSFTFVHCVS